MNSNWGEVKWNKLMVFWNVCIIFFKEVCD